ncbi:hypothetical protein EDD18DRAFT_1174768 [Armillaria luteobubalina]|uniref:F-box domain-containing protein n=1 Tax=Armillaria luteobubalina TaxID=153913 RepID=A0AA39UVE7_9AGAR|nr:hypothetical protein EDD18DRAFT_1174768 [Armillaria luteobubalina]
MIIFDPRLPLTSHKGQKDFSETVLAEVPLEVFIEIFSYLDPVDLLRLARTTRQFTKFLLSPSVDSIRLWRTARARIFGPVDLLGMSEPRYADLVFERHCNYCASDTDSEIVWRAFKRACRSCMLKLHVDFSALLTNNETVVLGQLVQNRSQLPFMESRWVPFKTDVRGFYGYFLPDMEKYAREYASLGGSTQAIRRWARKTTRDYSQHMRRVRMTRGWFFDHEEAHRASQRRRMIEERVLQVYERLSLLGWRTELDLMPINTIEGHSLVDRPEELTDEAWTTMEPVLVGILQRHRDERLVFDRFNAVRLLLTDVLKRYLIAKSATFAPDWVTLASIDDFKKIVSRPLSVRMTRNVFTSVISRLPEIISRWKSQQHASYLGMLRKEMQRQVGDSDLYLATSTFRCKACGQPVMYPKVLIHECNEILNRRSQCPSRAQDFPWINPSSWIFFDSEASESARSMVTVCGLDPAVATYTQMNLLHPLLECLDTHKDELRPIMWWQQMLVHASHHVEAAQRFRLVDCDDTEYTEKLESLSQFDWQEFYREGEKNCFRCLMCYEVCESPMLRGHMERIHPGCTVAEMALRSVHIADASFPVLYIALPRTVPSRRRNISAPRRIRDSP